MRRLIVVVLLAAILLSGCASRRPREPGVRDETDRPAFVPSNPRWVRYDYLPDNYPVLKGPAYTLYVAGLILVVTAMVVGLVVLEIWANSDD